MLKQIAILYLSVFCSWTDANTIGDTFSSYKDYVRSLSSQPMTTISQFNPAEHIKSYTENPTEQTYYKGIEQERNDLNTAAIAALSQDKAGKTVREQVTKRPVISINKNAEAIKQSERIEEESEALTQGISNEHANCEAKAAECSIKQHEERCSLFQEKTCTKSLLFNVDKEMVNKEIQITFTISAFPFRQAISINLINGEISNSMASRARPLPVTGQVSDTLGLQHECEQLTASILDSTHTALRSLSIVTRPTCANHGLLQLNVVGDFQHTNTTTLKLGVSASSQPFVSNQGLVDGCLELASLQTQGLCHLVKQDECLASQETRVIEDVSVTRDCWETQSTYRCKNGCESQETKGCFQLSSRCSQFDKTATCQQYEQVYQCPEKVCTPAVVCTKNLFCANGDCTQKIATQNEQFAQSIASLAAVGEMGQPVQKNPERLLFSGHAYSCEVKSLGYLDCCSNKGWGKKLKLSNCSEEERELGLAKKKYQAYFLGEYCAKEYPWPLTGCLVKNNTYCLFESKLARILQIEGRVVQGIHPKAMGDARSPRCAGFSVEELQKINMGAIDFVAPIYPYPGTTHVVEAGIAGDIHLNSEDSAVISERIKHHFGEPS